MRSLRLPYPSDQPGAPPKRTWYVGNVTRRPHPLLLGLVLLLCAGCRTSWGVENREVPVHVWLTAPGLATQGGTLQALVYVGSEKVVEGPVRFPAGVPTIMLPTAYVRAGDRLVSAVIGGGRLVAREEVEIEGESWVQIVVGPTSVGITYSETQPSPWGR